MMRKSVRNGAQMPHGDKRKQKKKKKAKRKKKENKSKES
jgi:hypothetical protein